MFALARAAQIIALGDGASAPQAEADAFFYAAYLSTALFIGAFEWLARRPLHEPPFPREK